MEQREELMRKGWEREEEHNERLQEQEKRKAFRAKNQKRH